MKDLIQEGRNIQDKFKNSILKEDLSNSEKSDAISKMYYTNPKTSSQHKTDSVKIYKRSKDNKIVFKGKYYGKDDFLNWTNEPWAKDMFNKDDIDPIIYFFDNWPKKGNEIELKGKATTHFVNVTPTNKTTISNKWPGGDLEDYEGLFVYQWDEDGKKRVVAHSLDDTWFLMTSVDGKSKFKIDDVLYDI
jgi:hypothetical protein